MTKELDFSGDETPESLVDDLIWSNISHNVENGNYTLDDAKKLFPEQSALIDAVYACEEAKRGFGDE